MAPTTKGATLTPREPQNRLLSNAYRWSIGQYHQLTRMGLFGSAKVELIEGLILEKEKMNPPHAGCVNVLQAVLAPLLPNGWVLRGQTPITLDDSEPQPDVAVVVGPHSRYFTSHPTPADIALVVEVADTTLEDDRTTMLRIYARNRIPVYWIVNLPERQIEIHTQPRAGKSPTYRQRQVASTTDSVSFPLEKTIVGPIPVADLLPPVSPP